LSLGAKGVRLAGISSKHDHGGRAKVQAVIEKVRFRGREYLASSISLDLYAALQDVRSFVSRGESGAPFAEGDLGRRVR